MEIQYRIGYIDEDVKQVKKYQRRFRDFKIEVIGYNFYKGMSLEELMSQVYESQIDLLMIDYKLRETNLVAFNGEAVESEFYDKKPLFPYIIFTNKVDQAEPFVEDWSRIFDKDEIFNEEEEDKEKIQHFITTLIKKIEQYRNHISRKKNEISSLLEKSKVKKLTQEEKHNILKLQKDLKVLDSSYQIEVPEYLLLQQNLSEIEDLKDDAEGFLRELIEKRKRQ